MWWPSLFLTKKCRKCLALISWKKAKDIFPDAKRVLLTAYSDTDAAIKAINDVQLDYYLNEALESAGRKALPGVR